MQVIEEKVSSKPVSDTISQRRTSLTPSGLGKKELIQAWREKASDEAKLLDSLSPTSVKSDKKDDGTPDNTEVLRNEESPSNREHDIYKLGEITRENSSSYEIESEMSASSYASVSESEDHEQKSLIRRRSSKSVSNSRKSSANDVNKPTKSGVSGANRRPQSQSVSVSKQQAPPRYSMSDVDDRHDIEIIKEQLNPLRRSSENRKFSASNSGGSNTFVYNKKSPERERTDSKPPTKKQSILIGDYQLGEVLGRGATGVVYQALNVKTGDFVAIKQVAKRNADEDIIKRELNILRSIQHPNIIKVIDCVETSDKFNLIFEYIENGSLTDILQNFGAFPEALVAFYTQQLLQGLAHVHDKGLIHRDIKASNVLVGKDGVIKLSDFGVASTDDSTDNKNLYGSPYWMAPEVIESNTYFKTSDIWSVGCTVIELLTCNPPYFDISPPNAMFKIVSDTHPPLPDPISIELKDFLLKCFERDPSKRSIAKDLINHPWICSGNTKSQRSSKAVPLRSFDDLRTVLIEYNQNNKQRIQTLRGTFKYPAEENINIDELLQYHNDDSSSDSLLSPSQSLVSLSKENNTVVVKEGILRSKHKYWCCIHENFPALAYYKKKEHYIKGKSPKGQILLLGCNVKKSNVVKKEPFGFVIQQRDNRRYFLAAETEEEQISWVDTIIKVESAANTATTTNEKIKKQDEIIKKLQNALQLLIDEKEGKNFNNLKRPNEAFYKEFFFFLALSVKRNHSEEDTHNPNSTRDINIHDLYETAQRENIPFHTWYIWIPQQFANLRQK